MRINKRFTVIAGAAALVAFGITGWLRSPAAAAGTLSVYAAYADTHSVAISPNMPNPWPNSPSTSPEWRGAYCSTWPSSADYNKCWDGAAIELVNGTSADMSVTVKVVVGNAAATHTYSLWGTFTVKAGDFTVLTETAFTNMDTSDTAPNSYNGGGTASCVNSGAIPQVYVTANGVTTQYSDPSQVLNTGGVDKRHCVNGAFVSSGKDESIPWTQIFPAGVTPVPTPTVTTTTPAPTPTTPAPTPTLTTCPSTAPAA